LLLSTGTKTSAIGTSVVVLREADHDVVSLRFRVKDKGDKVVIVVPVPASVLERQPLDRSAFAPLSSVVAPRLEELWEQDPCELHGMGPPSNPLPEPEAAKKKRGKDSEPKARPTGPAYEISLLEGKGSEVLAALKSKGVTPGTDVEPLIAAYADVGMKFVVAEIATADLEGSELPPLLIHAKAQELTLPTRLHAAGKAGPLDVFVLAPGQRFEAKNQSNVAVPTNLDVKVPASKNPAGFYAALVSRTFHDKPDSILTEYAWSATDCERCAAPLDAASITRLGLTFLPSAAGGQQEVIVLADGVSSEPGGPDDLRKALNDCYGKIIAKQPGVGASITVDVEVKDDVVQSAKAKPAPAELDGHAALAECATSSVKAAELGKSGSLTVTFSPTSRKFLSDLVLTKLRMQQSSVPEKDLLLGGARAIEGGRENGPEGKPEKKVYWAESNNNFQPRYVVRHAFKGAIKCVAPERGTWGPPPKGTSVKPAGKPGAAVPALETMIDGGLPDLAAFTIVSSKAPQLPAAPVSPTDIPSPGATPFPAPSNTATTPPGPEAGCSCRMVDARSGWSFAAAALLFAGWLARRGKRRKFETGDRE